MRFLLVYDRQSNATDFTTADLLANGNPQGLKNVATYGRFVVLWDKVVVLNQTSGGGVQKLFIKKYLKVPLKAQIASYADGNASAPVTGNLCLMYLSDTAAGATDADVNGFCRLKFIG